MTDFKPTHVHRDGGLYKYEEHGFHKEMVDSDWKPAVFYRGVDGVLRSTNPRRWEISFRPIQEPADDGGH